MERKKFYSNKTVFDPNYRNIQSELWALLSDEQREVVASIFCHLKNHAQIEIASALIDYIESDYEDIPSAYAWSSTIIGAWFHYLLYLLYDVEPAESLNKAPQQKTKSSIVSNFLKGFRK